MYKQVAFGPTKTVKETQADGVIHYSNLQTLDSYPTKLTDRLEYWATIKPEHPFICRKTEGIWLTYTYQETLTLIKSIAQYLINRGVTAEESLVILSENSLEHALLSLAATHIGIPYAPISPPYSLRSHDLQLLKKCLDTMTPKVVFAQNSQAYGRALDLVRREFPASTIITVDGEYGVKFLDLLLTVATDSVELLAANVHGGTVAKILFTSGSTGHPKGVINHQGMWCANLQQITQVLPFLAMTPPVFIDWLPWNHTFGGNHNFGLTLYHGGTLYIDDGKPTAEGIITTVENLREISPTAYFNVPKGYEMLIPYLESEEKLRKMFFQRLNILFYAGATLAQPIWNKLEALAVKTIGEKIPIITGLGCTESGPSAMFANWGGAFSGLLGVPVAGLDVKLVPSGDKLEARYKGPNVMTGYWRNLMATQAAFDDEGYYKTGDAVRFVDERDPDQGLVFDGRISEDFKLSTGTWVNVGVLKGKIISSGSPLIQDVVLTGLDKDYVGAILFLNIDACRTLVAQSEQMTSQELLSCQEVHQQLATWLYAFNSQATGSSSKVERFEVALEPPSIDAGEITDKGSLNQRAILKRRADLVAKMYAL